ncbi:MAG: glycoside hydrolase family 32 protein [Pseudobutyrivibrio sp.]|nr:glycoside hydrolase family 32 protein [Pseudobutyrivibrio sp.]
MHIEKKYLWFPINKKGTHEYLSLFCEGEKIHEFNIPFIQKQEAGYCEEYFASVLVSEYIGKDIDFEGDFSDEYLNSIRNENMPYNNVEPRPCLHFTANHGWINDPNGLVYDGQYYHLYFQYNPFNCIWDNMMWGHATSTDLVNWIQHDVVLFPDENGMMFSGSGIKKDDKLYFFYTAAGATRWSQSKLPTQRMAISQDGGLTLEKQPGVCVDVITKETRDPKVFWHEKSDAYIMVLYIDANDFGIFRSKDLYNWNPTQRLTLPDAWECPDLIPFNVDGREVWVFIAADGFFYAGDFDGYEFKTDGIKHEAYANKVPYAAQSYSGIKDRTIQIPWLKLNANGINYNGAMGYPRELSLCRLEDALSLSMKLPKEVADRFVVCDKVPDKGPFNLVIEDVGDCNWTFFSGDTKISYQAAERTIIIDDKSYKMLPESRGIFLAIDYNILEVTQGDNLLLGAYLLSGNTNTIVWESDFKPKVTVYRMEELWQH